MSELVFELWHGHSKVAVYVGMLAYILLIFEMVGLMALALRLDRRWLLPIVIPLAAWLILFTIDAGTIFDGRRILRAEEARNLSALRVLMFTFYLGVIWTFFHYRRKNVK